MTDPFYTVELQNPDASEPLRIKVVGNVPTDEINQHIRRNSRLPYPWAYQQDEQEREIAVIGGGPSLPDHIDEIQGLRDRGAFIMALNGASKWLSAGGIFPDTQLIIDAKQETSTLVDLQAKSHCFASQVHPDTIDQVGDVIMFHLASPGIEEQFPEERRNAGGYSLIGGGASAGNSALALAYTLGYRKMHLFGFDSSFRDGQSHAYAQPINDGELAVSVRHGDRMYWTTPTMNLQANLFLSLSGMLESMGCELEVYGDGLLPDRFRERKAIVDEKTKYRHIWNYPEYRRKSPGEKLVEEIVNRIPVGRVLDLGCGTARAGVALASYGYDVLLVDIADNCRDVEALSLPFLEHDLTQPLPEDWRAPYGYCCDVMEHVPPQDVDAVLRTIRDATDLGCMFRIEFTADGFGPTLIGSQLHLSIHDEAWWQAKLSEFWPTVLTGGDGIFFVATKEW